MLYLLCNLICYVTYVVTNVFHVGGLVLMYLIGDVYVVDVLVVTGEKVIVIDEVTAVVDDETTTTII